MVYKLQRFSIILATDVVRWYCFAGAVGERYKCYKCMQTVRLLKFDTLSCKQSFVIPTLIKDNCVVRF